MNLVKEELISRFGAENVQEVFFTGNTNNDPKLEGIERYPFILVDIQMRSKVKVLMTNGLSEYKMPVLDKFIGREHNELYFCLPSYWDIEDQNDEGMNWVFKVLYKLQKHLLEKNTWFGIGHTIPFSNPLGPISERMSQSYFFMNEPWFLEKELTTVELTDKMVNFLSVIPIFEDEFDFKIGKGTYKFQKKLGGQNVTELLDDFRRSALKTKWRFFGK